MLGRRIKICLLLLSLLLLAGCIGLNTSTPPGASSVTEQEVETETQSPEEGVKAETVQTPPVLMSDPVDVVSEQAEHYTVFGSELTRGDIAEVVFLSSTDDAPSDAWDVSQAQDGSILAWTLQSEPPYQLCIAAQGGMMAPSDCSGLFCGYSNAHLILFNGLFDTSGVTDMSSLFDSCPCLAELDVSGFDTSAVTDMQSMFRHCDALTSLDVSGFDTSAVTDMRSMFRRCGSLTSLDVSGFDFSAVTDVRWMFADCRALTSFDAGGFDFSRVELHEGYMKNVPMRFSATPLSGTPGFEGRNYDALFDGNPDTKWCLILDNVAYVEWKMACEGSVSALSLTSADNHDAYPGRNVGSWRLLGTDREKRQDGVWTVLGEMEAAGFAGHDNQNFLTHTTAFSGDAPAFEYYRLEITSTTGAQIFQISELSLEYR